MSWRGGFLRACLKKSVLSVPADVRRRRVLVFWRGARLLTSAHMKSEVNTDLHRRRKPNAFFAFDLAGRPFERPVRLGLAPLCSPYLRLWRPYPRLHSTCVSVNALRHTCGTRDFCSQSLLHSRSKVIGELSGRGTSQLRELVLPQSKPNVRVSPGLPEPRRRRAGWYPAMLHHSTRTRFSRWVEAAFRENVAYQSPDLRATVPAACSTLCAGY